MKRTHDERPTPAASAPPRQCRARSNLHLESSADSGDGALTVGSGHGAQPPSSSAETLAHVVARADRIAVVVVDRMQDFAIDDVQTAQARSRDADAWRQWTDDERVQARVRARHRVQFTADDWTAVQRAGRLLRWPMPFVSSSSSSSSTLDGGAPLVPSQLAEDDPGAAASSAAAAPRAQGPVANDMGAQDAEEPLVDVASPSAPSPPPSPAMLQHFEQSAQQQYLLVVVLDASVLMENSGNNGGIGGAGAADIRVRAHTMRALALRRCAFLHAALARKSRFLYVGRHDALVGRVVSAIGESQSGGAFCSARNANAKHFCEHAWRSLFADVGAATLALSEGEQPQPPAQPQPVGGAASAVAQPPRRSVPTSLDIVEAHVGNFVRRCVDNGSLSIINDILRQMQYSAAHMRNATMLLDSTARDGDQVDACRLAAVLYALHRACSAPAVRPVHHNLVQYDRVRHHQAAYASNGIGGGGHQHHARSVTSEAFARLLQARRMGATSRLLFDARTNQQPLRPQHGRDASVTGSSTLRKEDTASDDEEARSDEPQCVVCLSNRARYAPLPCGHLCLCGACRRDLQRRQPVHQCPMCKCVANSMARIFVSLQGANEKGSDGNNDACGDDGIASTTATEADGIVAKSAQNDGGATCDTTVVA